VTRPSEHSVFRLSGRCEVVNAGEQGIILRYDTGRGPDEWGAEHILPEKAQDFFRWLFPVQVATQDNVEYVSPYAFRARLSNLCRKHERGRTYTVLARRIGVTVMAISRYCRGLSVPQDHIALRMAQEFGWHWPTVLNELRPARLAQAKAGQDRKYSTDNHTRT
jgi:plasmid maintenance system antidote protein VapI